MTTKRRLHWVYLLGVFWYFAVLQFRGDSLNFHTTTFRRQILHSFISWLYDSVYEDLHFVYCKIDIVMETMLNIYSSQDANCNVRKLWKSRDLTTSSLSHKHTHRVRLVTIFSYLLRIVFPFHLTHILPLINNRAPLSLCMTTERTELMLGWHFTNSFKHVRS